ncbi:MAG: DNA gyrase subunit A [Candidatus Methanoliparum thermophilum]|uniref:DNA topoisomerase (ATP-hydrolyzing) n=1 Tax=Methanoliparum thermophilum TaxID=2491083 RepID=A0A520KRM2_METT2|nr:DNA gyrase subunit A [Candidatus Methanoliparum sp. LAM-1]RZN64434.1 MAG: DNA gyrase subunit A [Candidatus Methanoliparum thermophilum]BDC35979.1 DNA gyrase subunit A [Candidatus Methanoliparum sp. LAM-1]
MERLLEKDITEEVKSSYLDYAMSVIVSRAIPDIKDGLKPVQRRILYAMYETGITHNKPYKKSARVVGDVLGKYHPHGDLSVYDALVRLAQDFSMRYPLVEGHGNFGSIDGDPPAAMRYTEVRLNKIAEEMLEDIEKDTVDFVSNFDGSLREPLFLPSKIPNLLINGASGIAVGMATNIPPHNLSEIVDGILKYIDNPDISIEELNEIIKAPDFPTGGIVSIREVLNAYRSGKGTIRIRGKVKIEDKNTIIIEEIPYQVNKSMLVEKIADLAKKERIKGIKNILDESDRKGMRISIEVSNSIDKDYVIHQLYKNTPLESSFGINNMVLLDGRPRLLNLKEFIAEFVKHRVNIVVRRASYELNNAKERIHILEGLLVALNDIDSVIQIIKGSKNITEARENLFNRYRLSKKQVNAILDTKLQRLVSLEKKSIEDEYTSLLARIDELNNIILDKQKQYNLIKDELQKVKEDYGDERRTRIVKDFEKIEEEVLLPDIDYLVLLNNDDYIKKIPIDKFKTQKRGGRGISSINNSNISSLKLIRIANNRDKLLFFTNKGKVYSLDVSTIPENERTAKGRFIKNFIDLEKDEKIVFIIDYQDSNGSLIIATKNGLVKKTDLKLFEKIKANGKIAIRLNDDDKIVGVKKCKNDDDILLITKKGLLSRFKEREVRKTGRNTMGVIGMRFKDKDDEVVDLDTIDTEIEDVLIITEDGIGKRVSVNKFSVRHKGTKGVIAIKIKDGNYVKNILGVNDRYTLLTGSKNGFIFRINALKISKQGRTARGVNIMRLKDDSIVCIDKLSIDTIK